jgi:hypothetical protein
MRWSLQQADIEEIEMDIEMMMEQVMNVTNCMEMYEHCSRHSAFSFSWVFLEAMEF